MAYAGIDLGGTTVKVGIVNDNGKILAEASAPTNPKRPYQEMTRDFITCVMDAMNKSDTQMEQLASIGIGIPGIADQQTGKVIFCPNIGWRDIPLREELQKYIDRPVFIDNDATVAGLAESYAGVSKNCRSSVFLTLGTGVGAGIIIDGKPWSGAHGIGSELGHMTLVADGIPCNCGNNGCMERYCSATAIIQMAKQVCMTYPESRMVALAGGDPNSLNARCVFDAAKEGDKPALGIFEKYVDYLAMAVNNVSTFLDPEMIVLGGGVSHAGSFLLDAVKARLPRYLLYKTLPCARLELAQLGNDAGIIGAAFLGKANGAAAQG